jgi:hypothetical protein
MKEMLSNLADGQIELYRNVSNLFHLRCHVCLRRPGHGGMGQDHSNYSAHTRGRLAHFVFTYSYDRI